MTVAKKLFQLQQIDLDIQKKQEELEDVRRKLSGNSVLVSKKEQLAKNESYLADLLKRQRGMEWEVDDLRSTISRIGEKLYDGKIKNPKELVGLEHEIGTMRSTLKQKEDSLLNVMGEVEGAQLKVDKEREEVKIFEADWWREQKILTENEYVITGQIDALIKVRETLVNSIPAKAVELYEGIRTRKIQVVVKVEQGMCQGCRLTLPMSEWQRAKAGSLVQCGSCGRILYLG